MPSSSASRESDQAVGMTPAQRAARIEAQDRGKVFTEAWPAVRRVQKHLALLGIPSTSRIERLRLWRLVSDAALQAWEIEVQQLDSLNSLKADPALEAHVVE